MASAGIPYESNLAHYLKEHSTPQFQNVVLPPEGDIPQIIVSPNAKHMAIISGNKIFVQTKNDFEGQPTVSHEITTDRIKSAAFSPKLDYLAALTEGGPKLWQWVNEKWVPKDLLKIKEDHRKFDKISFSHGQSCQRRYELVNIVIIITDRSDLYRHSKLHFPKEIKSQFIL
jgi:hypothetical protein